MIRPVALIVLDGWGLAPDGPGNAVARARTPVFDRLWAEAPHTELAASGEAVGLPAGQIGNSEVGHMNLGAGRVVMQSLSYIGTAIDDGSFYENEVLRETLRRSRDDGGAVHLMGLVSDGGVHASMEHLYALLELARREGAGPVFVHAFTDGRDTAPDSGRGFVADLQTRIDDLDHEAHIATVIGRYWAMDRDKRWERTKKAYDAIVCGRAAYEASDAEAAVAAAYDRGETDEFIEPTVVTSAGDRAGTVEDGDAVIVFNFRADRVRQISYALLGSGGGMEGRGDDWDGFERCRVPRIHYASLMQYDAELDAPYALALPELRDGLAEVVSRAGLPQFHTAETEKYAHVTYFFNTKVEEPFDGEDRNLVPSPKVPTYDLQPEMSADEVTRATVQRLDEADDAFVLLNYANPDMVGHTGDVDAAIAACEAVDRGLGQLVDAIVAKGGALVILADHGNAEQMIDPETGGPHTAHTTNPVPCLVVGAGELELRDGGVLGDVAPTVLALLGLEAPDAMTGTSLIVAD